MRPSEQERRQRAALAAWDREARRHDLAEARGDLAAKAIMESRTRGILSPVQLLHERRAAR